MAFPLIPNLDDKLQTLTIGSSAAKLGNFSPLTSYVLITVEQADVRVRIDGTNPTSNTGHLLRQDEPLVWPVGLAKAARFIRAAGADAKIHASGLKQ